MTDVPPHAAAEAVPRGEGREEERGGKGLADDEDDPLLPAAAREDCAVEDFRRSTRLPPVPPVPLVFTVPGDIPGMLPPGPGRAG